MKFAPGHAGTAKHLKKIMFLLNCSYTDKIQFQILKHCETILWLWLGVFVCLKIGKMQLEMDSHVLVDFLTCMLMLCECVHTFCHGEIPNLNSGVAAGCHKLRTTAMIPEITTVLGKQFYLIKIKVGTNVKFYN